MAVQKFFDICMKKSKEKTKIYHKKKKREKRGIDFLWEIWNGAPELRSMAAWWGGGEERWPPSGGGVMATAVAVCCVVCWDSSCHRLAHTHTCVLCLQLNSTSTSTLTVSWPSVLFVNYQLFSSWLLIVAVVVQVPPTCSPHWHWKTLKVKCFISIYNISDLLALAGWNMR